MTRMSGTVSRGLRTPIFNDGDRLDLLLPALLMEAAASEAFEIRDRDVLAITESVVARSQGNYASLDDIRRDLLNKLPSPCPVLGLSLPILSRNRFSILLKAFAAVAPKLVLLLSYPSDEVGNQLFAEQLMQGKSINPWQDVLSEEELIRHFGVPTHRFTGVNYLNFYRELVEGEGASCEIIFANDPRAILKKTPDVICCDIHSRERSKELLVQAGARTVLGLDDILNQSSREHGYNPDYGLLGSNKADEDRVKLFPRDGQKLVDKIAEGIFALSGKRVEVMIYGDGAFKDPVGRIWELADPVVSPAYTEGLAGTPNELKLKYLADSDYKGLGAQEQRRLITERIREKDSDLTGKMVSEGTTPRRLTDLLGSLADLTSGSGDKGTPVVYIQGYFDSYADE